ncbi:MAG: hypothetical protein ACI4SF_05960 [Oscillospiraceae bacterium]
MQIKKIIAAAAASLVALSAVAFSAFADDYATLCFDTDVSISMFQSYGSTTETGFSVSIDEQTKSGGNGSLMLSEKVTESITSENRFGGLYLESSSFELDSFAGCTITMKVMFDKEAAKLSNSFSFFTDGIVWMTYDVSNQQAGQWVDVALTVPENADNTRIGFAIPVFESYNGTVAYVDDLTITKPDGTTVANIGDQKESSKIEVSIGKTSRIILLVVVCVIIVAVIAGVGFIISKFQNRFTE